MIDKIIRQNGRTTLSSAKGVLASPAPSSIPPTPPPPGGGGGAEEELLDVRGEAAVAQVAEEDGAEVQVPATAADAAFSPPSSSHGTLLVFDASAHANVPRLLVDDAAAAVRHRGHASPARRGGRSAAPRHRGEGRWRDADAECVPPHHHSTTFVPPFVLLAVPAAVARVGILGRGRHACRVVVHD